MFGHDLWKFKTPMDKECHPDLDDTPIVTPKEASKYRGMVGSCNWVITLGRFDIGCTIQALSRYSMAPQEGHFKAMKRVMGYIKAHYKGRVIIDPNLRDWSMYSMDTAIIGESSIQALLKSYPIICHLRKDHCNR